MLTGPSRPRWLRRLLIAAAVVVALVVGALAALPLFADADAVQRAVERRISALAGGEVHYDSMSVRFFPQPRAEIRNATVRIPGVIDGRIGALDVRIALLPLLAGNVRVAAVRIERPELEVRIEPGAGGGGDPLAAYRAALGPVVAALVREAPGMSFAVDGGKLDIVYGGRRLLALADLAGEAEVAVDAIQASASCVAGLWRTAKAQVKITPGTLAGSARLDVAGLRIAELADALGADGPVRATAAIDLGVDATTDGRDTVRAAVTATAPGIVVARGARTADLGALRAGVDAVRGGTALVVTLRELALGQLVAGASGTLRAASDGTVPQVELQVPALDLARLRETALALAGDLDAVQTAAVIATAGTARALAVAVAGADFASLADPRSIRADAQVEGLALAFLELGIAVKNGAGRIALADGALRGNALAGAIGNSSFTGGALVLELFPAVALRDLSAAVDADLAGTLAIVRHALGPGGDGALAGIESLQGRAAGRVAYETHGRHARFAVEAARIRATGRYRGVPFPLAVTRGELRYAGDRLRARGLDGTVGRSSVQGAAAELSFGAEPSVHAASGDAVIVLDELYPWLASLEGLRRPASAIPTATGTVSVRLARLAGPLNAPAALEYEAVIRPQPVRLAGPALPAPVTLAGGEVRITPRMVALDRLDASMLDARVVASGTVQDYAAAEPRFDLALTDGSAGPQTLDWARKRWALPAKAMPRAPLTLTSGRLQRSGGTGAPLLVQGAVGLAGGVRTEFDLTAQDGHLDLRRLAMKDPDTDTTASLKWARSIAELKFSGNLDNRTLARVLAEPPAGQGALRGDFSATIDFADPRQSSATGTLEGDRIDILERWDIPVAIERVRVEVAGDAVQIREGAIAVAGERLALTGSVTRQPKTFGLDLRVTADAVDVERLLRAFPRGGAKPAAGAWKLPVDGRVAVDAKAVAYGRHVVRPLSGTVTLAPERIVAEVKEARLCGIALPLSAVLVPGNVNVTGRIEARAQPLAGTVTCLLGEHFAMTGTLDLDADLSANGPADALARVARGTFRFTARDGQIQKAPAMARILSLDAVAGLLRARPSELMASGLDYSELAVAGSLDAGRVRIANGTLNAAALGFAWTGEIDVPAGQLDMHGIVAPFGRIQGAMQHIPIVGRILGSRAIGIPLSVTGDLRDPRVVPLGPAAIGQSVVNLLGAVVKTPIDLLDPFVTREPRAP